MQQRDFKLGLFGRTYLDTIVYLDKIKLGETNKAKYITKTSGGIFNISKANIPLLRTYCYSDSQVEAFIISESKTSTRSSIVHSLSKKTKPTIKEELLDWLHVAYVDDLSYVDVLDNLNVKLSLDFCTLDPRGEYMDLINNASLIFDSRERKPLYNSIKTNTPLILHDKNGCECIINGESVSRGFTKPMDDIHVNGAGDIFAGIFLSEYYKSTLDKAIESASRMTSSYLIQ